MQFVNFWLVSVAFLTAAYVSAINGRRTGVAATIAIGGAGVTLAFQLLEVRTRYLVRAGEHALKQLQRSLAETTQVPELEILAAVDAHSTSRAGYGLVIRLMHFGVFLAFLAAAGYAIWS